MMRCKKHGTTAGPLCIECAEEKQSPSALVVPIDEPEPERSPAIRAGDRFRAARMHAAKALRIIGRTRREPTR
jgi:hypothetical protein